MRYVLYSLILAGLTGAAALADPVGSITGTVVDIGTGRAVANVPITITRVESQPRSWTIKTNRRGEFAEVSLEPGRYIIVATLPGETLGCAMDDVFSGESAHMKIGIGGRAIMCSGPRVHPAMVDPGATADVYRI